MMERRGTIITFYSYKGGVGRSFTLANVATMLTLWGYRVLCVDWDLEAPGLHQYFAEHIQDRQKPGVVHLIEAHARGRTKRWQDHLTRVRVRGRTLHLMVAGTSRPNYAAKLQALDWDELYSSKKVRLGAYIERLRSEWKAAYDFILVDSRTGLSDSAGICSIQLPDMLVAVSSPNQQSLDGLVEVVDSCQDARNHLPLARPRLLVLPLPSRLENRVEWKISREWIGKFTVAFEPFYRDWLHRSVSPEDVVQHTKLAHIPYWSYGEGLAVLEEGTKDPEGIGRTFETIAALLAQRLQDAEVLMRDRDQYVAQATASSQRKRTGRRARYNYDAYFVYPNEQSKIAQSVARTLESQGMRILDPSSRGVRRSATYKDASGIQHARHMVVMIGSTVEVPAWEVAQFLVDTTKDPGSLRLIVVVLLKGAEEESVPKYLQPFQWVKMPGPALATKEIIKALGGVATRASPPKSWARSVRRNGRELKATVEETGDDIWFNLLLEVRSTDSKRALPPTVTFQLPSEFPESERHVEVEDGVARLEVLTYGAFTTHVITDVGRPRMKLDLATIPGVPATFRESEGSGS